MISHAESQLFHSPTISVDKSFAFHQPKTEYSVLPQTSDAESSVISEQPKSLSDEVFSPKSSESGLYVNIYTES